MKLWGIESYIAWHLHIYGCLERSSQTSISENYTVPCLWRDWCHKEGNIVDWHGCLIHGLANWFCMDVGVVLLLTLTSWWPILKSSSFGSHSWQSNVVEFLSPTSMSGRGAHILLGPLAHLERPFW